MRGRGLAVRHCLPLALSSAPCHLGGPRLQTGVFVDGCTSGRQLEGAPEQFPHKSKNRPSQNTHRESKLREGVENLGAREVSLY